MSLQVLTYIVVGLSFVLYIGIAVWSRAHTTGDFYIAGRGVSPLANGMATAADWMSAASFISMAGIIAFSGYDGSVYLIGMGDSDKLDSCGPDSYAARSGFLANR